MRTFKASFCCLLLVTSSAWADWVKIFLVDTATVYIDPTTIRKDGDLSRVWVLMNLKQRKPEGEMSLRSRLEYDCKVERQRMLAMSGHSEPLAAGTTTYTHQINDDKWGDIAPGTPDEAIQKIVCAK